MTDETADRDRAVELRQVANDIAADWPVGAEILRDAAADIERLRSLAGAPTADMLARALHEEDCGCGDYDEQEDPRYIDAARKALAGAPTADVTDELRQRLRRALGIDDSVVVDDDGLVKDVEDWICRARVFAPADVPAAAEDAADIGWALLGHTIQPEEGGR